MEDHFDIELDLLKQRLLTMASHAEIAIKEAVRALLDRDYELALRVKANDRIIDQFEMEIDDLAIQLLPKAREASDLRFVTMAMKISQNLERVADEAAKIAKRARDLTQEPAIKANVDLRLLASLALDLLKRALDSFVNRNPGAAREIIPRDRQVDQLNKEIYSRLIEFMEKNPDTIRRCLHLITVSRSLERVADHATNVAEEVVFLCEAQDIRHGLKGSTRDSLVAHLNSVRQPV